MSSYSSSESWAKTSHKHLLENSLDQGHVSSDLGFGSVDKDIIN